MKTRQTFIFLMAIVSYSVLYAQKVGDSKIIVKVNDTVNLYKRIKLSMIRSDFMIKDLEIDTIQSYPLEYLTNSYLIATSIIKGDRVEITGIYGPKRKNFIGSESSLGSLEKVVYFKGANAWRVLKAVADRIGGSVYFEK